MSTTQRNGRDARKGLKRAIAPVLSGTTWPRCRIHFMRNMLAMIPRTAQEPVAAIVRTIFAQPDATTAQAQLRKVVDGLRGRFPQAATLLEQVAEDVLAYLHFPAVHRRQLHSTNPLKRLNQEIKRRSAVVGIFPHRASLLRLVGGCWRSRMTNGPWRTGGSSAPSRSSCSRSRS